MFRLTFYIILRDGGLWFHRSPFVLEAGDLVEHHEDNEQILLFNWAALHLGKYPELKLLFHIPNGGKRNVREAARFKRMGVKPGVPDLFLPVPRGRFHGLFIELKAAKGKLSGYQRQWLQDLESSGYAACVCFGFDEAKSDIIKYLDGNF